MKFKTHISIKDLNVWYEKHQVLNNINIDIPDKKITVIIGPSGCGKTTLLKSFNRLIDLQDGVMVSGQVFVDGENIYDEKIEVTHLRKKMGLLSQRPQVLPMSIYDNVAYSPRIHGLKNKKKLDELVEHELNEAGLWNEVKERLSGPASKLSIGQQQRLCLARGLAADPEIILGDEPTSALDPISAEKIEQRFLDLKNKYTIVLVTHNLRQAKRLADYVIFLYLGNIIEYGKADEIFKNPKYSKTKDYLNGKFIEEHKIDKELNLKGTVCPDNFVKTKVALEELEVGQVLRIIIDYEQAVIEVPKTIEYEGHKVLEVKSINRTDWEIIIEKRNDGEI
ncbi:phosphate ABC transporter ATP-binding protein [Candidatus Desantisbacteria bacterium]|nr:phosphate ABC transporter ATP-binding protein [Candidatus Desantisbacteria bacterium]